MTGKAKLNAVILGIWIASLITTIMIPTQWYGNYVFNNKVETENTWSQFLDEYPSITYRAKVTASTTGIFSEANPVDIEVKIFNANIANLTDYYTHIKFLDAEKITQGSDVMRLESSPEGGWIAKGTITFYESERIWMILSPQEPEGMILNLQPNEVDYILRQTAILSIAPASDTLNMQFNSFGVKVAFIFGTFSILLLAPIFEAFLPPEKKNESKTNHSDPRDKSNQPKK